MPCAHSPGWPRTLRLAHRGRPRSDASAYSTARGQPLEQLRLVAGEPEVAQRDLRVREGRAPAPRAGAPGSWYFCAQRMRGRGALWATPVAKLSRANPPGGEPHAVAQADAPGRARRRSCPESGRPSSASGIVGARPRPGSARGRSPTRRLRCRPPSTLSTCIAKSLGLVVARAAGGGRAARPGRGGSRGLHEQLAERGCA